MEINVSCDSYIAYQDIIDSLDDEQKLELFKRYNDDVRDDLDLDDNINESIEEFFYDLSCNPEESSIIFQEIIMDECIIEYETEDHSGEITVFDLLDVNNRYQVYNIKAIPILERYIKVIVEHEGNDSSTAWRDIELEKWVSFNNHINATSMIYIPDCKVFLSYYSGFVYIAGDYTILYALQEGTFKEAEIVLFEEWTNKRYLNLKYICSNDEGLIQYQINDIDKTPLGRIDRISNFNWTNNHNKSQSLNYDSQSHLAYLYDNWKNLFKLSIDNVLGILNKGV